jgi:hypothetical protein
VLRLHSPLIVRNRDGDGLGQQWDFLLLVKLREVRMLQAGQGVHSLLRVEL